MDKTVTTVYFIRHGKVDDQIIKETPCLHGPDQPLNSLGKKQILDLANVFKVKRISFDAIYTSPLERAFDSAKILRSNLFTYPKLFIMHNLIATPKPGWDGRPVEELRAVDYDIFAKPEYCSETPKEVENRVMKCFTRIIEMNRGKTIAIVSHSEELGFLANRIINPSGETRKSIMFRRQGIAWRMNFDELGRCFECEFISPEMEIGRQVERLVPDFRKLVS